MTTSGKRYLCLLVVLLGSLSNTFAIATVSCIAEQWCWDPQFQTTQYLVSLTTQRTRTQAQSFCAAQKGRLASPTNNANAAMLSVAGAGSAWTTVTLVNDTFWIDDTTNQSASLNAWIIPSTLTHIYNCVVLVNTSSVLDTVPCTNTSIATVCQRSVGTPWVTVEMVALEYALFDVRVTSKSDARAFCTGLNASADISFIPQAAIQSIAGNLTAVLSPGFSTVAAVGHDSWTNGNGIFWTQLFNTYNNEYYDPTGQGGLSGSTPQCTVWNVSNSSFAVQPCSVPVAVICARFATPKTREFCIRNVTTNLGYKYLPSNWSTAVDLYKGMSIPESDQACRRDLGNMTKFLDVPSLVSCFGSWAVVGVGTPLFQGKWIDGSTSAKTGIFATTGASSSCYAVSTLGPNNANITALNPVPDCTPASAVAAICEYPLGTVQFSVSSKTLQLAPGCRAYVVITLNTPLVSGMSVSICPQTAGGSITEATCANFTDSTPNTAFAYITAGGASTVTYGAICDAAHSSWCSASPSTVITVTAASTISASVLLGSSGTPTTLSGSSLPLSPPSTAVGSTVTLVLRVAASAFGTVVNLTTSVPVDNLTFPTTLIVPASAVAVDTIINITGRSPTTSFILYANFTSGYPAGGCTIAPTGNPRLGAALATLRFVVAKTITPDWTDGPFYAFGPKNLLAFTFSALPTGNGIRSFACVRASTISNAAVMSTIACVHGASNSTTVQLELTHNNYAAIKNTFYVVFDTYGSSAAEYSQSRFLVNFTVVIFNMSVSGLEPLEFLDTNMTVKMQIPYLTPASESLNIYLYPNASSATCTQLATVSGVAPVDYFSTSTLLVYRFVPSGNNCLTSGHLYLTLLGTLKSFFNVVYDLQDYTVNPGEYLIVQPQVTDLFIGADPVAVTFALPKAFSATGKSLTLNVLFGGRTNSTVAMASPSSLSFVSEGPQSAVMLWSGLSVGANLRVDVTFQAGSSSQFRPPVLGNINVRTRTNIAVTAPTAVTYFLQAWYTATVVFLVAPPAGMYTLVGFDTSSTMLECQPFNLTSTITTLSGSILFRATNRQLTTLTVQLTGPAAGGYIISPVNLSVPSVSPAVDVIVTAPSILLVDATSCADCYVTFAITAAPTASDRVVVNLTTSKSLNASQSILVWPLGSTQTLTISIKPLLEDPDATLNYTLTSYAQDGSLTPEANRSSEIRVIHIAARQKGVVKTTSWIDGDTRALLSTSTTIKVDRDAYLNISVTRPPTAGTSLMVIPRFSSVLPLADIQPPNASFSPTSATSVQLRFRGLNVGSSALIFDLSDTAATQFTSPSDSILTGTQITLTVADRTPMQVASDTPMPTVLVAGASPVTVVITFSVAPTFYLTASVTASPNVLVITPPLLSWTPTGSLRQNYTVSANATSVVPVIVTVTPLVASSGYLGFSSSLTTQRPSNITVTFPTGNVFCSESATVLINISLPVTGSVPLEISLNTNCPQCTVSPTNQQPYTFAGGSTTTSLTATITYSTLAISTAQVVAVIVTVVQSTAATQYSFPSSFNGNITFIPRRNIYLLAPSTLLFYVGAPGAINILLSQDPDPGAFLRISDDGFRATQQAYWTGANTTVGTNQTLWLKFSTAGIFTINFVITASSDVQKNRYVAPGSLTANVIPKVTLAVTSSLRPIQVVGNSNAQTIVLVLSRVPQVPMNATPQFTSPLGEIVAFSPAYVTWDPATDTSLTLTRYINVTGLRRGEITDLYFSFDSTLPEELSQSQTSVFASSLRFDALYSVQFVGSDAQAYVDGSTTRFINVSVSQTGYFGVTLVPTFSTAGAIRFLTSLVTFVPGGRLWQIVNYTCLQPVVSGSISLAWVQGNEFSSAITGTVSFSISPRIQASLISGGVSLDNTSVLNVQTDISTTFTVELQDFHSSDGTNTVEFDLSYAVLGAAPNPSFVSITPSSLVFQRSLLSQTFTMVTGSHKPFVFELILVAPDSPEFAPGFNVTVNVSVSVEVVVTSFPTLVYLGTDNARTFSVRPLNPPPSATFLDLVIVTDCTSTGLGTVVPLTPLEWSSALSSSVPVQITATGVGTCSVTIRRSIGTVPESVAFYFTQSVTMVESPTLIWANSSSRGVKPTLGVPYPFDFRAAQVNISLYAVLPRGVTLTPPFNYTVVGPDSAASTQAASFILTSDKSVDDEPLGVLSQFVTPGNCELLQIGFSQSDGHTINMAFGPCPNLIILEGETLTVTITSLALGGVHPVSRNTSVQLYVTKYTANIVPQLIKDSSTGLAAAAAIGTALFASPMGLQAARATVFMSLSNCPNDNWVQSQGDIEWYQSFSGPSNQFGSYTDLGRWLFIAVVNTLVLLLAILVHFLVCLGFYIQRRQGSTKTLMQVCGRLKFPGLSVMIICVWVLPTVNAALRVAFYSPVANYNVFGFLLVIPWAIILPAWLFNLLWLNDDLKYELSTTKENWKKFLLFKIMRPEGVWTHSSKSFITRYGALFTECRGAFRWYFGFEYLCTLFYAAAFAVEPTTSRGCVTKAGAMTALLGVQMCAALLWRPFVRSFTNGLFGLFYALQFIAMIILTSQLSQRVRNETLQKGAVGILLASTIVMLIGGIWFALVGIGLELSRRYGLSNKYSKKKKKLAAMDNADNGEDDDPALNIPEPSVQTATPFAKRNDDSEEDDDPEVAKAVALLEERAVPAVGVFRTPMRGAEHSFSALRQAELERRRQALQRHPVNTGPTRRAALNDDDLDLIIASSEGHTGAQEGSSKEEAPGASSAATKLKVFNRFTVVEAIDPEML